MENLYHYLWKSGMFGRLLKEEGGEEIEVIDPGIHNPDAGPDFFNSKIKIGSTEWAGNVEIHVKASDWFRHNHHTDPAYDSVILHVVGVSDKRINRSDGSLIPQAVISFPERFFRTLLVLSEDMDNVKCAPFISSIPDIIKNDWLETLSIERLQEKAERVRNIYEATGKDWEQTCFIVLARALGFGLNSEPFEILGRSIPLRVLHHHADNLLQLESLIFGQAGLLDSSINLQDEHYQYLCREYYFLARKYVLKPMDGAMWKFSRTRPQNFPHRRLAFLAASCFGGFSLFSKMKESLSDTEKIIALFQVQPEGYWQYHYSFDSISRSGAIFLSDSSIMLLIINCVVPLMYAYCALHGDYETGERIVNFEMGIPAENNMIVRQWKTLGFDSGNAWRSQGLLQLRKEYCDKRKCLYCRLGTYLLRNSSN